jgi:hypothetical protein
MLQQYSPSEREIRLSVNLHWSLGTAIGDFSIIHKVGEGPAA